MKEPFLRDGQLFAVNSLSNGNILCGGVGTGKTRVSLFYYFKEMGGWIDENGYTPMDDNIIVDLYIITTAKKRDSKDWESEMIPFRMSTNPSLMKYKINIKVDSWNNINKYRNVRGAFFIFDEQRVVSNGSWSRGFIRIAQNNRWILLSATPGDRWIDYIPVFVANGFYRNPSEFKLEHCRYTYYKNYPKLEGYYNTGRLIRLRNKILVDIPMEKTTVPHHIDIYCNYDTNAYKKAIKTRWDPFKDEPIQQASVLCNVLRRIVNSDMDRAVALGSILEDHPCSIIFYNFDYERELLIDILNNTGYKVSEWSGHAHQDIPSGNRWCYLVQYTAGNEGWNCIKTDTIIFWSQNYSYKVMAQASGRIDRLNTPFKDLYYYHLKSRSGIDLAISKALDQKKKFNETSWIKRSWRDD